MISKDILDKLDEVIEMRRKGSMDQLCVDENRVISELCLHPDLEPREIAKRLNTRKDADYSNERVIKILRDLKLSNRTERAQIIQETLEMSQYVYDFFNGDLYAYKRFKDHEKKSYEALSMDAHTTRMRCILIALFTRFPPLQKLRFADDIFYRGGVRSKACLNDIVNKVYKVVGGSKQTEETEEEQITQKEEHIRRLNEMLEEMQNEFERKLEESKNQEITGFFSALNSEKYGYMLDGLFSAKAGLDELRKRNYELPLEINGLTILVRKLIQFVKESGINPVIRIGERMTVKSQDIENYNYLGSPFAYEGEEKQVEVISPGWVYKEKDIQLSRPTIKEVKKEPAND
ncbi:MAG: hypothetical protein LBG73_09445 [Spirochaetaceae bacterium]|jgi:hypothetical protein|nr:hypothetical protein [Spirochaetaceae bacterium]